MSNNLKVNAKTKPLEFKKKHNLLVEEVNTKVSGQEVENLIQADKDIINQIVYEEETGYVTFPKNILPLKIISSNNDVSFFNYSSMKMLNDNGTATNFDILLQNDNRIQLQVNYDEEYGNIVDIEYIHKDGVGDIDLNTYYLYHPITSGGTKLYRHVVNFSLSSTTYTLAYISTDNTPSTYISNAGTNGITIADSTKLISQPTKDLGESIVYVKYARAGVYNVLLISNDTVLDLSTAAGLHDTVTEL